MLKKLISIIFTVIITLGIFSSTAFTADTPSSWAAEQINKAIEANLVPLSFQSAYTQATNRAEFCALSVALYENVIGTITGRTTFTDTMDINVEKAASIGVVSGVGDNRFDPDAKLTREQAAVMLSRLADAVGKPFEKKAATFTDNSKVSSWALEGVGQVQAAGIMGGVGGNTFAPQDPYTREQSIITILRTFDAVKSGATTDVPKPTDLPSEDINETEKELLGFWADNPEDTIEKVLSNGRWIEFKADGTFSLRYNVYWHMSKSQKMLAAKVFLTGNFKVENNKIITYNILQSAEESLDGYGGTYSDRPTTLPAWDYKFSDSHPNGGSWPGLNWVTINLLDWDSESDWYSYVKRDDY